jgi:hypothetical protein
MMGEINKRASRGLIWFGDKKSGSFYVSSKQMHVLLIRLARAPFQDRKILYKAVSLQ